MEGKYRLYNIVGYGNWCNQGSDHGIRVEYGIVEPMEGQDKLGWSGDIWEYGRDIVVQGDWEDRDDDFTFRDSE